MHVDGDRDIFGRPKAWRDFLLISPTAKATGMGFAWTAIANDASANYYNAAGLVFLESPEICANYFKCLPGLSPDRDYVYLAGALPKNNYALGIDLIYFTPCKIEVIDAEGNALGKYTVKRIAGKVNYAKKIYSNLSTSLGLKYVYQDYYYSWVEPCFSPSVHGFNPDGSGWTLAFDLNVLYKILPNISIGSVLHNVGPNFTCVEGGSSDPVPWTYRLGIAFKPVENRYFSATVSGEITKILVGLFSDPEKSFSEQLAYEAWEAWKGIGLELGAFDVMFLRGGWFWDMEGERTGPTFGGGIRIKKFSFDIGIDENIYEFTTQNRKLSLNYTF